MSQRMLVTFNAGSSTVKLGLFILEGDEARRIGKGMIDFHKPPLRFYLLEGPDTFDVALESDPAAELHEVLGEAFRRLSWHYDMDQITAAGHRIVHGGDTFAGPIPLDDAALETLQALTSLAPLHQPQGLRLVRAINRLRPGLPQTACHSAL
jgi:acetate kinase